LYLLPVGSAPVPKCVVPSMFASSSSASKAASVSGVIVLGTVRCVPFARSPLSWRIVRISAGVICRPRISVLCS
jgi:hypothetical protein